MAVALAAGLLGGAVMRPNLDEGGHLPAPQLFTTAEADQSDMSFPTYPGKVPDYVYGTDWKKQTLAYASAPPVREEAYLETTPPNQSEAQDSPARSVYEATDDAVLTAGEGDAPSPSYPSIDGGQPYPPPPAEVG